MPANYALVPVEVGDDGDQYIDTDKLIMLGEADFDGVAEIGDAIEGTRRRRRTTRSQRPMTVHHHRRGKKKTRAQSGIFGLDSVTVTAGDNGQLQQSIQEPVFFQRLVFDGDSAFFKVTDVKIGAKSQMSGTAPFPAGAFRPDATNAGFSINKPGRVGQYVTVSVTNIDTVNDRTIQGMIKTLEHYGARG